MRRDTGQDHASDQNHGDNTGLARQYDPAEPRAFLVRSDLTPNAGFQAVETGGRHSPPEYLQIAFKHGAHSSVQDQYAGAALIPREGSVLRLRTPYSTVPIHAVKEEPCL